MKSWPFHEAKDHLSEMLERAKDEGPQLIVRHGRAEGAVISIEELRGLRTGGGEGELTVKDYLMMPTPVVETFDAPETGPELALRPTIVFE